MATSTQHFNLIKSSVTDNVSVNDLNTNFENIDTIMYDNQQKSEGALNDLADAFSAASTYDVGDLCIYQNQLYKCTTAISTAGAWDSTKWTATTLAAEMGKGLHSYSTSEQVVGTWIDGRAIYERVVVFSPSFVISDSSFTNTNIDSTNMDNVIYACTIHDDGTSNGTLIADPTRENHTLLGLQTGRNNNGVTCKTLILQYTKTTD